MSEPTKTQTTLAQRDAYPGVPRWVKAFGIIFAAVVLLIALLHVSGHGPGARLHGQPSETGGRAQGPSSQP